MRGILDSTSTELLLPELVVKVLKDSIYDPFIYPSLYTLASMMHPPLALPRAGPIPAPLFPFSLFSLHPPCIVFGLSIDGQGSQG